MVAHDSSSSSPSPAAKVLAGTILFALIFIAVCQLPVAMEQTELDWSWQGALSYFAVHQFHFGSQIIYTYGPFGYMMTGMYAGGDYDYLSAGRIFYEALFALVTALFAVRFGSVVFGLGTLASLLLYARFEFDSLAILLLAFASLLLLGEKHSKAELLIASLVFAITPLVKFSFLALAALCLATVVLFLMFRGRRRDGISVVAVTFVFFLFSWTAVAGQRLEDVPMFVKAGSEVAYGFSQTMAVSAPRELVTPERLLLLSFALLLVSVTASTRIRIVGVARFLVFAACSALTWQQGTVRADYGHAKVLPLALQIFALLLLVMQFRETSKGAWRTTTSLAAAGTVIASFWVIHLIHKFPEFQALGSLQDASIIFRGRLRALTIYNDIKTFQTKNFEKAQAAHHLPKISALIGKRTVDVFGDEIGIALLNSWNYTPRFSIQSFCAYTKFLQDRNADFVRGPSAPDFYVWKSAAIDNRLVPETDTPAFLAILARYRPVISENGYWLFEKSASIAQEPQTTSAEGSSQIGDPINLKELAAGQADILQLFLRPTWMATLSSSTPWVNIEIEQKSGTKSQYKVPPLLGRVGFIINPPISSDLQLYFMLRGDPVDPVKSISVSILPEFRRAFKKTYQYRITRIAKAFPKRNVGSMAGLVGFGVEPHDIRANSPILIYTVDQKNVLFVHAPSEFVVDIPASAQGVSGSYGVMPGAFTNVPQQQVLSFKVTGTQGAEQRTVMTANARESGMKHFHLRLDPGQYSTLRFSASCQPTCDGGWTYWAGIHLDPEK